MDARRGGGDCGASNDMADRNLRVSMPTHSAISSEVPGEQSHAGRSAKARRRATFSTRHLGLAALAVAGGTLAVPSAAEARVKTWFLGPNPGCEHPGWIGAQTRAPISTEVSIKANYGYACSSGYSGWVRAWIGGGYSTGTELGHANTGFWPTHGSVRDYAKLNSEPTNERSHDVTAFSSRNP
jgi:hypothetical protein